MTPLPPSTLTAEELIVKYDNLIKATIVKIFNKVSSHYQIEYDDLYQEAMIIVLNVVRLWDASKGVYIGIYLKQALYNGLLCYCRDFLPHFYTKDLEKSTEEKTYSKRMMVNVSSLDYLVERDSNFTAPRIM